MEDAGERCFNELVFRGFLQSADPTVVTGLKIKSCSMDGAIRSFVVDMAKRENFEFAAGLPTHLGYQLNIRKIVQPLLQDARRKGQKGYVDENSSAGDDDPTSEDDWKHPMDMVL
ncbi:hypothetical protein E2562_032286 [Oryza meyeriana var. granulata]|uniref:Uncharacterized protein n=1 Tax=Oryza meyeriana var. granulata TaxID=110450 RepID=A0A6G1F0P3_9ORYZ|nr:hypothetical protein E2562_032286 [Oryza meyeriana var. granulata]